MLPAPIPAVLVIPPAQVLYDRKAYLFAKAFLLRHIRRCPAVQRVIRGLGIGERAFLEGYLSFYWSQLAGQFRPQLDAIFRRLLISAQNKAMMANVIGGATPGGVDAIATYLMTDFTVVPPRYTGDPFLVLQHYDSPSRPNDWQHLLDDIVANVKPRGQIRREPKCLWPRYCNAIIAIARFLCQRDPRTGNRKFATGADFYNWVDIQLAGALPLPANTASSQAFFAWLNSQDPYPPAVRRFALARTFRPRRPNYMIEISFALICDSLKELGYLIYGKPDSQLQNIFTALHLCARPEDDECLLRAILRVASSNNTTPYDVDKLFWLIGSGNFHHHEVQCSSIRHQFLAYMQRHLPAYPPPACP